ncbi:hypothetical protein I6B53_10770 [Schaalia sp. 19OD2882]|uniref:hypothetical protein n=1 Tax=Schaalia sp. 19OD2882 TaxID=2794089 RepID=UPI001C1EE7B0|nr:hypothetical protein [Schaalia sp. 19OD2882]QWW19540.1 hypothetical protein I6B53_10770 [Schaalia sp. 19OD2882]
MSNDRNKRPSRGEEIAFLAMEHVLGVEIKLADAGAGDKMPDGVWVYPDDGDKRAIVEITSPPDTEYMKSCAEAKRTGEHHIESGSITLCPGGLAQALTEILSKDWATENFDKLLAQPADERHLFLSGLSYRNQFYFHLLSEKCDDGIEQVGDLVLPEGISDVWFAGYSTRHHLQRDTFDLYFTRFQVSSGWHCHKVLIREQHLPSPEPSMADDWFPKHLRQPKDRMIRHPNY